MTAGRPAAGPDKMGGEPFAGEVPVRAAEEPGRADDQGPPMFDRHLVLEQLGGWRGMLDATLPTIAFIVANSLRGLQVGIYAALGAAVLVFLLRVVRRESVQQAFSGLFAVAIAVAIAAWSGQARDFFVFGIIRNAAIGAVLLGSIAIRWPLVGVIAEFLAPSHLGALATHSFPGLRRRIDETLHPRRPAAAAAKRRDAEPEPECHWRDDPRMLRAYGWLTFMWGITFLLRVVVQGPLYQANEVELLGTASLLLGLPITAVEVVATLWVVARLHRHRCEAPAGPAAQDAGPVDGDERPAA